MQLWLLWCTLVDWINIFCMVSIMFEGNMSEQIEDKRREKEKIPLKLHLKRCVFKKIIRLMSVILKKFDCRSMSKCVRKFLNLRNYEWLNDGGLYNGLFTRCHAIMSTCHNYRLANILIINLHKDFWAENILKFRKVVDFIKMWIALRIDVCSVSFGVETRQAYARNRICRALAIFKEVSIA
jgi:hypothetical protein